MSKFPIYCPRCKERSGARIVCGWPDPDSIQRSMRGEVVFGGCDLLLDGADRQCTRCGYSWIANRKQWQWTGEHWHLPDYCRFEVRSPERAQWLSWRGSVVEIGKGDGKKPERLEVDKTLLRYSMFQLEMDAINA